MANSTKIIIGVVVTLALLAGAYFFTTSSDKPASNSPLQSSQTTQAAQPQAAIGDDAALSDKFLSLLLNIRTIKLDQSIFSSPSFTSLKDFTTTISPDNNPGRDNPFAPIGIDGGATIAAASLSTGVPISIASTSATFVGTLSLGAVAQSKYFEYSTANVIPLSNVTANITSSSTNGVFSFAISGLLPDTTYYVRAVAKVNDVLIYGSVVPFKTLVR